MTDPVNKPLTWSKSYPAYAERHDMYRVLQELLKELIISKPADPLTFVKDEMPTIARLLHAPRVFLVGPNVVTQGIGRNMAGKCGAKFLTLAEIVESSPHSVRNVLMACVKESGKRFDESVRKLLVSTIKVRLAKPDCQRNGYILYGFPQNKLQAKSAQQNGLFPREVYVLLPDPSGSGDKSKSDSDKTDSDRVSLPNMNITQMTEVAESYDNELCKVIPFEKWSSTKKQDIEGELLANLVSIKACGSPWIPKILIIGPPFSGRSTVAADLNRRFSFVNVDFIELVRGTASLDDDLAKGCRKYLEDMQPMNDDLVKRLLKRRLLRNDCERKGWILHGFPDTANQLKILEMLQIVPNRVFLLYCPDDVCAARLEAKRHEVLNRKISDSESMPFINENNFREFPYGKQSFRARFDTFALNLTEISNYFGSQMVYVDSTQKLQNVMKFVEDAVLKPPVARYPDPTHSH